MPSVPEPVSEQVSVHGLRLHFLRWDPAPTNGRRVPPFVLVHGLASTSHIWDLVAPRLADAGHTVFALDQRGHGESEQPEDGYDFPSVVTDLSAFVSAAGVPRPFVLVGHSWGASVVLHFAVADPSAVAGLVLLDGGTSSPGERFTWDEALARLTPPDIDGRTWDDLRSRMNSRNDLYNDPRVAAIGRSLFHIDATGRVFRRLKIPNHLKIVRALWEQRPAELLRRLECPLLVLPARQASDAPEMATNKANAVQRVLDLQPRARVKWFEDTIHDVPLQRPGDLAHELLAFAKAVGPRESSHHATI
jgi:pimeloyl-ACP methyl ester carboxylesterase